MTLHVSMAIILVEVSSYIYGFSCCVRFAVLAHSVLSQTSYMFFSMLVVVVFVKTFRLALVMLNNAYIVMSCKGNSHLSIAGPRNSDYFRCFRCKE